MTKDEMRQLLYGATIGQSFDDATLKALGLPEKEWERIRGIARDVKELHRMGDHQGARSLCDDWSAFLAGKIVDNGQPDDFDPSNPDHIDRIRR
jgi:hypothetical protein